MEIFYVTVIERACRDPQEARAMSRLRRASLNWIKQSLSQGEITYAFRDEQRRTSHFFIRSQRHSNLYRLLDADPLISYSDVRVEPVIESSDLVDILSDQLGDDDLRFPGWKMDEIRFRPKQLDPHGCYWLAIKTVAPFSPLLSEAEQRQIHANTLVSQRAHSDPREILDVNPVGRPIGILVMEANCRQSVLDHVSGCEVFIDTNVEICALMTVEQAIAANDDEMLVRHPGVMSADFTLPPLIECK